MISVKEKDEIEVDYGVVKLELKLLMDERNISISEMSKMTKIKYDIVKKYYNGNYYWYDSNAIAKFCYALKCKPCDIIKYYQNGGLFND